MRCTDLLHGHSMLCHFLKGLKSQLSSSQVKHKNQHLRNEHCTKEGGSYVCRYGENNVCCTLPVEGVSDRDYERHVYKHHTTTMPFSGMSRKVSTSSNSSDKPYPNHSWTSCAAQNLPAVLNDPNKGKQKDFFTKTWGDIFVEINSVPDPIYLPHITIRHFEHYLKRIAKKHKRMKINSSVPKPHTHAELLQTFPSLRIGKFPEKNHFDISVIPKIFLQPNFDLSNEETFNAVYTQAITSSNTGKTEGPITNISPKLLQEKLSHYLDMVEVQIAQQVAQKSEIFLHAMTSHDVLMEQLGQTVSVVKNFREKIQRVDKGLVKDPLLILKNERCRRNYQQVYHKLNIMSVVIKTQPSIQLLLSSPDYVGALDLIYSNKELLKEELADIHSFRHLSSQLSEMIQVIEKLMAEEFERYCTSDLNRPFLDNECEVVESEKLTCTVMGMLRSGKFDFTDMYEKEIKSAIKAAMKQAVIEIVSVRDFSEDLSLDEQLKALSVEEWILLLSNTSKVLLRLLRRVKKGIEIMEAAADISAGTPSSESDSLDLIIIESGDWILSNEDHKTVKQKLHKLLVTVCEYSQEGCAQLLSSRTLIWREEESKLPNASYWLAEHASLSNLKELAALVTRASDEWEELCPVKEALPQMVFPLRRAFKIQATKYMKKFHEVMKEKLSYILDAEPWRRTDVPASFQKLVELISEKGTFSVSKEITESIKKDGKICVENELIINGEKYAVVGTVLMLVNIVAEYCLHAEEIPSCADILLRNLRDLLTMFNSRCAKLILGGEAISDRTGLKKITSINLALLFRALQLLLWLIPHVRLHFKNLLGENLKDNFDDIIKEIKDHSNDIKKRQINILNTLIMVELKTWAAKPPVPSMSFKNICKHIIKLHEAVSDILPPNQIQELYKGVHAGFKEILSERLHKMNIVNDGSPSHGLVTSELVFYLQDLKKVGGLPPEHLELSAMNDIWLNNYSS
ncbi:vacuolar protein sorting-associated protein 54 isoform X2 [Cimex lectularius]|uniref:Vacuolar protein sorting-associated protein 54 n=1 Tax=Cimex lectularius TaxID=79782 RepID=A0A8I6SIP2_CIMLE|nr:vacuolar protein sorting-associated protein 54 isoform X2 [Cimex lectularius]